MHLWEEKRSEGNCIGRGFFMGRRRLGKEKVRVSEGRGVGLKELKSLECKREGIGRGL